MCKIVFYYEEPPVERVFEVDISFVNLQINLLWNALHFTLSHLIFKRQIYLSINCC